MAKKVSKKSSISKKNKNDSSLIMILFLAVIISVVVLISSIFTDTMQIFENRRETKELGIRYEELLEEEASLNSEVVKLQDPEYVARYAREKFLYTKDGEKILRIVDGKVVKLDNKTEE